MKKKLLPYILLASSLFTLAACNNDKHDDPEPTPVVEKKFVLDAESLNLELDQEFVLGYKVENIDGPIRWSSSNSNVVSTTNNNLIAKNIGEAVITAQAGDIVRTCSISVVSGDTGQYFVDSSKAINIEKGGEGVVPEFHYYVIDEGKKKEILGEVPTYEVKDSAIAKIENGKILPLEVGQTTVKVSYPKASSEFILNVCTKIITNENQFLNMIANKEVGTFYSLANDLDFTGKTYDAYSTSDDLTNYGICFKGTLEGNGCTVKGINIVGKSKHNSIFGCLYNAHIKDVNFENVVLNNVSAQSMAILANGITGDDCEIKNVKISCDIKGSNTGNLNLITSKYLENSYTLFESATSYKQVSFGSSKLTNLVIEAKFDGKTMGEANYNICPKDPYDFLPECNNVLIYAPGGYETEIEGVKVFANKLDLVWYAHNEKCLPDTNWDYTEQFKSPSLLKASSSSGFVFNQGDKAEIDSEYEIIKVNNKGVENVLYPYGANIEGFIYGDHPAEVSKSAVFVNQRWASYAANLTVPAADIDITQFKKVCFFVRTKTFNKSFITIKDVNTGRDYSTLLYDCEVSNKWVKVEMEKSGENNWTVYIGKDKINGTYKATYFKDIPLRFNDTKYYYSEMLGVKDPNVTPKSWVSLGALATKPNGEELAATNSVLCDAVPSTQSSIVEGAGSVDLATFKDQDMNQSGEFKFYARGAQAGENYFIVSLDGSQTIGGIPGLVSFKASTTNWTCFKFVINNNKMSIYRNDSFMVEIDKVAFSRFGVQLSGSKFYMTEMFCYK